MTSIDFAGFDFRGSFRDITQGLVLKPLLHSYLFNAKLPAITIHLDESEMGERRPDDWFHPSTHPLWSEMALYRYLTQPDIFPGEQMQYMNTLSVTVGKILHEFVQACLKDLGVLPPELQVCKVCPPERGCKEAGVLDADLGERGHVDGMLDLTQITSVLPPKRYPIFEFKTSNPQKLVSVQDMDLDGFRKKWPEYYGQQQSYQRMSGAPYSILLMMATGYPWEMREFHIPHDLGYATEVADKYRRVRQAVADQRPPTCCGSKGCAAFTLCQQAGAVR